jgi:hypothetical protein
VKCWQWTYLLKEGLIRPGLDRATVLRISQHFEIPRNFSGMVPCGRGPAGQPGNCYMEDYNCDRGDLAPGTVLVIYKLKEGSSAGPTEPHDVPGKVWVVDYCGLRDAGEAYPPVPPPVTPRSSI